MLKEYVSQKLPFLQMSGKHVKPQGKRERQEDSRMTGGGPDPMPVGEEREPDSAPAAAMERPEPVEPAAPGPEQPEGQADFEAGMRLCRERDYAQALEPLLRLLTGEPRYS